MKRGIVATILLLSLSGCMVGRARVVMRDANVAILALEGNDMNRARNDANRQMAQHCGPRGFGITREEEAIVGSSLQAGTTGVNSNFSASSRQETELRLFFVCGPMPMPAQQAAQTLPAQPSAQPQENAQPQPSAQQHDAH